MRKRTRYVKVCVMWSLAIALMVSATGATASAAPASHTGAAGALGPRPSSSHVARWNYVGSLGQLAVDSGAAAAPCTGRLQSTCIYSVGGLQNPNGFSAQGSKRAQMFNPRTNSWRSVASLRSQAASIASAAAPCGRSAKHVCVYAIGGTSSRSFQRYSPVTNRWTVHPSPFTWLQSTAAAAAPCVNGTGRTCLYAIGGTSSDNNTPTNAVDMYNPASGTWRSVASLPKARENAGATAAPCLNIAHKTCIYVIGGLSTQQEPVRSVEVFNPAKNRWTYGPSVESPLYNVQVAAGPCNKHSVATCVFTVAGAGKPLPCGPATCFGPLSAVQRFNPRVGKWSAGPVTNTPRANGEASSAPCVRPLSRSCVYVFGGRSNANAAALRSVEMLGTFGHPNVPFRWTLAGQLNHERLGLAGGVAPCLRALRHNCVYAAGGMGSAGTLSSVEMYSPPSNTWATCLGRNSTDFRSGCRKAYTGPKPHPPLVAALPEPLQWSGSAAAPCTRIPGTTCLYIVGGLNAAGKVVGSTWMFNPAQNRWSAVAPLPAARFYAGVAPAPCRNALRRTCIYAVAGSDTNSAPTGAVTMFDPTTDHWSSLQSLPQSRSGLAAVAAPCTGASATCVYALGGFDTSSAAQRSVEMYNPTTDTWNAERSFSVARYGLAATPARCPHKAARTCIYVAGGDTGPHSNTALSSVEAYAPQTGTWQRVPSLNVTAEEFVVAATSCHGQPGRRCLYAVGGIVGNQEDILTTNQTFELGSNH